MTGRGLHILAGLVAAATALLTPPALAGDVQSSFDAVFGGGEAAVRPAPGPRSPLGPIVPAPGVVFASPFEAQIAGLASPAMGRIGVAAMDLNSGRMVTVLGNQPFPMASTGKIAIVSTFLDGVDNGRYRLDDRYPLMIAVRSPKFAAGPAPVRPGIALPAEELIELAIERSDNRATDALLAAIGGPQAVDRWLERVGVKGMHIDRDIATLVRDDGAVNPATTIDTRDSTTPEAMVRLLSGLYQGRWLSTASRDVLMSAMSHCATGLHRLKAAIPEEALVGHKTGTLANTSSDVGLIRTPEGHTVALAIYVTGQGSKPRREYRIASIARALYQGYHVEDMVATHTVSR